MAAEEEQGEQAERQTRNDLLIFFGSIIAFIGYFLPWQSIVFDPPHGMLVVNGQEMSSFTYAISGINPAEAATGSAKFLYGSLLTLLLLGLFHFFRLFLNPSAANRVMQTIASFAHLKFTTNVTGYIQALIHAFLAFLLVSFFVLYVGLEHYNFPALFAERLGGGVDAIKAGQYASIHIGIGLLAMLAGFAIAGFAVLRKIAIVLVVLILTIIVLAIFHSPLLGQLFHFLGF